jgi:hypothetical protein
MDGGLPAELRSAGQARAPVPTWAVPTFDGEGRFD